MYQPVTTREPETAVKTGVQGRLSIGIVVAAMIIILIAGLGVTQRSAAPEYPTWVPAEPAAVAPSVPATSGKTSTGLVVDPNAATGIESSLLPIQELQGAQAPAQQQAPVQGQALGPAGQSGFGPNTGSGSGTSSGTGQVTHVPRAPKCGPCSLIMADGSLADWQDAGDYAAPRIEKSGRFTNRSRLVNEVNRVLALAKSSFDSNLEEALKASGY